MELTYQKPTFDQLPDVIAKMASDLEEIKLSIQKNNHPQIEIDRWFDLNEFCDYVPGKIAPATGYGLVSRKEVPSHKRGKKLYFLKSEIDAWLRAGRRKTTTEIEIEADTFLSNNKRRSHN